MRTPILIAGYLAAIVAANLLVAAYGPAVVIVNAFVFIGLDLVARDHLHDAWRGDWRRMGGLILAGGALSAALSAAALPVAVASCAAFLAAGAADALAYHALRARPYLVRSNGSNLPGAVLDSLVFLGLMAAQGALPWALVLPLAGAQTLAKVAGGLVWSVALVRLRERAQEAA